MNIRKITALVTFASVVSGCEDFQMRANGPDKTIDKGIDKKYLSQLEAGIGLIRTAVTTGSLMTVSRVISPRASTNTASLSALVWHPRPKPLVTSKKVAQASSATRFNLDLSDITSKRAGVFYTAALFVCPHWQCAYLRPI